ncbi:MAG: MazG nucleotide pyrophosphohydrolase domain-containing protein [Phenylobacterium sp.]|uniref:MazG nucleotide pyrophosphohydrolase domain-containing protein n=1 Tax=Phenylobacterium sp. TaxID=1871053 RepID=UPI00391CAD3F
MDLAALSNRAWALRELYARLETQRYGRPWSRQEVALGFLGDVGDLMKLIQAKEGVRHIPDADASLAHELADCLWSVLVLARLYGVDLEAAFLNTLDELEAGVGARLNP